MNYVMVVSYNGAKYLREQIDSILSQTNGKWHLYIHDDGSKDEMTDFRTSLIRQYAT